MGRMNMRLAGRYQIVRQLGGGGMGDVFQAVDVETGQAVAAKIMRPTDEDPLDALLRFQQEGTVLSTLRHPNIVRVFGTFLEDQTACIVMEFLEGRDLSQILQSGQLTLERVKNIGTQVAAALAYAHERGIIHRDIKPDNIMVVGNDHVKVADFGIARILRPGSILNTAQGVSIGTPLYMAPEQIEGHTVDGRTDIYSLGVVLYHMVTGRPPFQGDNPLTIAFKHVHEAPDPPREIKESVPQDWEAVILKTLAKDPDERYHSAADLANALAELGTSVAEVDVSPSSATGTNSSQAAPDTAMKPGLDANKDWLRATAPRRSVEVSPDQNGGDQAEPESEQERPPALGATALQPAVEAAAEVASRGDPAPTIASQPAAPERSIPPSAEPSRSKRVRADRRILWPVAAGAGLVIVAAFIAGFFLFRRTDHASTVTPPTQSAIWFSVRCQSPSGMAVDRHGDIYVADSGNNRILKLSPAGKVLQIIGGNGTSSPLSAPSGVAVDLSGNMYVADTSNNRVVKFSRAGKVLWTWRGRGTESGRLRSPAGVAIGAQGNIYVADTGDNQIQHLSSSGTWQTPYIGFTHPTGITVDRRADIFVADTGSNAVEELAWSTDLLNTTTAGQLAGPRDVAVDTHGNVYVADTGNSRIVKFSPGFKVLKIWGGQGTGEFDHPAAVAVDSSGHVYVADSGHNRIGEISPRAL